MDVAVVIPLFNGEEWVRETLESVRSQTLRPSEIVVVDDGSTDASPSIVRDFAGARLLQNPGKGPNAARNHGLRNTTAEAIAFLDQDDLWHPEHLQRLASVLRRHPNSPAAFAGKTIVQGDDLPQYATAESGAEPYDPWADFPKNTLGEPARALIRRRALTQAGGWSMQYDGCSDYHLWLKLALQDTPVVNGAVTAARRKHNASYSNRLRKEKLVRYYSRHVAASKDGLVRRREAGLAAPYEPRHEASKALIGLLEGVVEGAFDKQCRAVRAFDRTSTGESRHAFMCVYETFRWYMRPHVRRVGRRQHALELLSLLEQCSEADASRLRTTLRRWAFAHLPAKVLLRQCPWSLPCWRHLLGRIHEKVSSLVV